MVSIHLMLLFIGCLLRRLQNSEGFNTSHVTVYRMRRTGLDYRKNGFNTSHVTVYRLSRIFLLSVNQVSIHLMLLFIAGKRIKKRRAEEFQYISCYCLSAIVVDFSPCELCFNTSHVTVYPASFALQLFASMFQYISCYCLSIYRRNKNGRICVSIHLMLLFIFHVNSPFN